MIVACHSPTRDHLSCWLKASTGTPLASAFIQRSSIIEAVRATLWGKGFAYSRSSSGVFVTAFYLFRLYFLVFQGVRERYGLDRCASRCGTAHVRPPRREHHEPHDVAMGRRYRWFCWLFRSSSAFFTIEPMLFGEFFKGAIFVNLMGIH
jgi:NADH-quinone oxidoreductase subunit L